MRRQGFKFISNKTEVSQDISEQDLSARPQQQDYGQNGNKIKQK